MFSGIRSSCGTDLNDSGIASPVELSSRLRFGISGVELVRHLVEAG